MKSSIKGSAEIMLGEIARDDISFDSLPIESTLVVDKYSDLLDVAKVKSLLKASGGDPGHDNLIPPGTMLLFRGDKYHCGDTNPHDWHRTAMFMNSYRKSMGRIVSDVQMHPIQAAINQYRQDGDQNALFHRIKKSEILYGKSNKPPLTSLITWPINGDKANSLNKYNTFVKKRYEKKYW